MLQWTKGLRAQLLALVLIAVIPAFGLLGYDAVTERREAIVQAEREATNLARLAAREQSRLFASARQLLLSLSNSSEIRAMRSPDACNRLLADVIKRYPYYNNIGVAAVDGTIYCSALPFSQPVDIADRAYFRRALRTRGVGVGQYQVGRITKLPAINLGQSILDDAGRVKAVIFLAINLAWLSEMTGGINLTPDTTVAVFDINGTVLAHYPDPERWLGKSQKGTALMRAAQGRSGGGIVEGRGLDGVERLYAVAPLSDKDLRGVYVGVGISRAAAMSAANRSLVRNLFGMLAVMTLGVALAWSGGGAPILRRIAALTLAARRIRAGDLTPPTDLMQGGGELEELGRTFEEMAGALHRIDRAHRTLSEVKRLVLHATDEPALLHEVCRNIVTHVGYRVAYIVYAGEDEQRLLKPMAHEGFLGGITALKKTLADVSWAAGQGPVATTIRTGKPYVAQHLLTDPHFAPWREDALNHRVASLATFPLAIDQMVIGALAIYAAEPNAFEPRELNLLTEAVQDVAFGVALLRARIEQERAHATIEHMVHYDRLTELPNHAFFEEHLRRALMEARSFDRQLAAMIVDLNRLRDVNDAFGFHHGDHVLKEVGVRLGRILRSGSLLARMRGDEFAVVCHVTGPDDAEAVVREIVDSISIPFNIGGIMIDIDSTVGIAMYPEHGREGPQLMRRADVAMNDAKKAAKRYAFYRREQDEHRAQRLAMVGELRHAIGTSELSLFYQPKVNIADGRICGMEALVRWMHPERGMVPPDEFIGLAEQSGLMKPLTDWVVAEALRESATWRRNGVTLPIAVNLSAHNLRDPAFVQSIENKLCEFEAAPDWIELEITEGAVMEDPVSALEILSELRNIGITLFIDDFGTGYSSLGYLKKLPVDAVKIDKSFVIDMIDDQDDEAIVRTTINLGHELGLRVVAEGVETRRAFDRLASLGCDVAQGYFISKPMSEQDVRNWFDHSSWAANDASRHRRGPVPVLRPAAPRKA